MGEQYLMDSNAVIDYLGGKLPKAISLLMNEVVDAIPNVSIITKIEVLGFNALPQDYQLLVNFLKTLLFSN